MTENQLVNAELTKARTELARTRHQREEMAIARERGELIEKRLVERQAAYLMIAFRQAMMNLGITWARRFLGLSDVREAKRLIDEMARSTLTELADLPQKVTDPNWLSSVEGDGQEEDRIHPATGAEIRAEQKKEKIRRQKKTETMRKLRSKG